MLAPRSGALILIVGAALTGCEADVEGLVRLTVPPEAVPGDNEPGLHRSVFDAEATLLEPEPALIFEPHDRMQMQGGALRLVFTGRSFLAFWVENRAGKLRAVAQRVGPTAGPKVDVLPEAESLDDAIQYRPLALVESDRVVIVWWTRRAVMIAWTNFDGVLTEGPVFVRAYAGPNEHYASVLRPNPLGEGYLLFGNDFAGRDDALRVTGISPRGELWSFETIGGVFANEVFEAGSIARADEGYLVSWNTRRPGPASPNEVFVTHLDANFVPSARKRVAAVEDLRAGLLWPDGRPEFLATAEYAKGLRFFGLAGGLDRTVESAVWSQVVPETNGRRLGIVLQTGARTAPPSEGLPTGVSFRAWDPDRDALSDPVVLQADDNRCVESAEGVAAGDEVGVAWVMGCGERRLYFARVRAR